MSFHLTNNQEDVPIPIFQNSFVKQEEDSKNLLELVNILNQVSKVVEVKYGQVLMSNQQDNETLEETVNRVYRKSFPNDIENLFSLLHSLYVFKDNRFAFETIFIKADYLTRFISEERLLQEYERFYEPFTMDGKMKALKRSEKLAIDSGYERHHLILKKYVVNSIFGKNAEMNTNDISLFWLEDIAKHVS